MYSALLYSERRAGGLKTQIICRNAMVLARMVEEILYTVEENLTTNVKKK